MKKYLPFVAAISLTAAAAANSAESWWPQFRGPNASGISDSAKPPVDFGPGTNQLWKIAVPSGASSPCVWNDWIFLTAFDAGKLQTICYDRRDGRLLWKQNAPAETIEEYNTTEGSPAASTVATDGKHVVSYFGSCGLFCYDTKGKELWKYLLPVAETAGGFGSGGSPVILDGLVLVNRDQKKVCSLLAVDLRSGKKVWEAARPDVTQSFGTPIFWKDNGANEVVMSGSLKMKAYDVKTGKERWTLDGMPSFTCTTPVVGDGLLFFAGWSPGKDAGSKMSWERISKADANGDGMITPEEMTAAGMGSFFKALDYNGDGKITADDLDKMNANMAKGENVLVAVKPGGQGALTAQQVVWKQTKGLPYVPSPLHYDGRVYLVKDGGLVSSFDARTGKAFYEQERIDAIGNYYSSPVAADGKIYVTSLTGRVTVLAAGGEAPKILHQADFGERISTTPALVGDKLYVRTTSAMYAFGGPATASHRE